jgi:hypothetical protein
MLVLFGDCFLFYSIYAEVEDFQDLEQQQALVEGKSLLHSR